MKAKKIIKITKRILGTLCFLFLFYTAFGGLSDLLMHKQVEGKWDMTAKVVGFFNEEPNSFDVMFFGSSHMYCSVDPVLVEEETGLSSYVFATQQQPLWITYHYMVEALKTQTPKVMFVEIHMASTPNLYMDEATNHTAIDPLPFSQNKVEMIRASAPADKQRYYLFDIMKYHERWKELEKLDYTRKYETKKDPFKGYVGLTEAGIWVYKPDISKVQGRARITEKNAFYMDKMMDLAEERGIRLVFLKTPSNATARQKICYNGAAAVAAARGVEFIDYNTPELYEKLDLQSKTDFYDIHHLNRAGMEKFLPDLCERYLKMENIEN